MHVPQVLPNPGARRHVGYSGAEAPHGRTNASVNAAPASHSNSWRPLCEWPSYPSGESLRLGQNVAESFGFGRWSSGAEVVVRLDNLPISHAQHEHGGQLEPAAGRAVSAAVGELRDDDLRISGFVKSDVAGNHAHAGGISGGEVVA